MFEVGFTEIVLILGLALLVLGPEKLPALAEKVGRWTGRARSMARQLRTQLEQEVTLDEMTKSRPAPPPQSPPDPVATPDPTLASMHSEPRPGEFSHHAYGADVATAAPDPSAPGNDNLVADNVDPKPAQ